MATTPFVNASILATPSAISDLPTERSLHIHIRGRMTGTAAGFPLRLDRGGIIGEVSNFPLTCRGIGVGSAEQLSGQRGYEFKKSERQNGTGFPCNGMELRPRQRAAAETPVGTGQPHNELSMIPFEDDNLKAYKLLLRIEIALRELLRISLEEEFGPQWRKRLPGDLLKKIKESQKEENRPQFGYICLGPLYYLTFGELLIILRQKAGRSVADRLGGDCIVKQLENIFVPRNAICHSRPVSSIGLKTIETLYAEIEMALTAEALAQLIANPDAGLAQDQAASGMIPALKGVLRDLPNLPSSFKIPEVFQAAASQFWWADDSLAGFNRTVIEGAIANIREYNELSGGVGCAANRQRYIDKQQMKTGVQNAITELEKAKL